MPAVEALLRDGGFLSFRGTVRPEWIDAHDHMNVLGYDTLFQMAERAFFDAQGVGAGYPESGFGYFRLEKHVRHLAELRLGDAVAVTTLLLWTDLKRVHMFHQAWNLAGGVRVATMEALSVHVDLGARRSVQQRDGSIAARWLQTLAAHDPLPRPEGTGRAIELRKGA